MICEDPIGFAYLVLTFHDVAEGEEVPLQILKREVVDTLRLDSKSGMIAHSKGNVVQVQFTYGKSFKMDAPLNVLIKGEKYSNFTISYGYQDNSIHSSF